MEKRAAGHGLACNAIQRNRQPVLSKTSRRLYHNQLWHTIGIGEACLPLEVVSYATNTDYLHDVKA